MTEQVDEMSILRHCDEPLRLRWNTLAGWYVDNAAALPDISERVDGVVEYVRADIHQGAVEALEVIRDLLQECSGCYLDRNDAYAAHDKAVEALATLMRGQ